MVPKPIAPSYSAEIIASNDDLLREVLVRLPIKSLIKFKSVSKRWLSLIDDDKFCRRRSLVTSPSSGLFLKCSSVSKIEFINFSKTSNLNPSKGPFRILSLLPTTLTFPEFQSFSPVMGYCCYVLMISTLKVASFTCTILPQSSTRNSLNCLFRTAEVVPPAVSV